MNFKQNERCIFTWKLRLNINLFDLWFFLKFCAGFWLLIFDRWKKLRIGLVGRWKFVFGWFCIIGVGLNIFWFEYEFGFMGFFFLMYGFMGFMCLLVCSSDLMKLGVLIEVMLFVRFDEDNFFFLVAGILNSVFLGFV